MPASVVRARYQRDKVAIIQVMRFTSEQCHIDTDTRHDLRDVPRGLLASALRDIGMFREAVERREAPDA